MRAKSRKLNLTGTYHFLPSLTIHKERKESSINSHKFNKNITFSLKTLTNKWGMRYNNIGIRDKLLKNDEPI